MTDQQQTPPPSPPTNSAEAAARLATLTQDKAWGERLTAGDMITAREFNELSSMAASGSSDIDVAMSGALPDMPDSGLRMMAGTVDMLRDIGIGEEVIKQALGGYEITRAEYDLTAAYKSRVMKDPTFVRAYLSGEVEARQKMTLANIVLSSTIKTETAA